MSHADAPPVSPQPGASALPHKINIIIIRLELKPVGKETKNAQIWVRDLFTRFTMNKMNHLSSAPVFGLKDNCSQLVAGSQGDGVGLGRGAGTYLVAP